MAEEKTTTEETQTEEQKSTDEITNSDVKNHPLFVKLAQEVSSLRGELTSRIEQEEKAKQEAQIKLAEEEKRYEDALRLREEEANKLKSKYEQEILERDIKSELLKSGFQNDTFIRGAITGYDKEQSVSEYVAALLSDESNAVFLSADKSKPSAPTKAPVSSGNSHMSTQQALAWEKSEDPEKRAQSRAFLKTYFKEHGHFPKT